MDTMAIASLSMSMAKTNLTRSVGVGVMKNAMELAEQTGEQIAEMIESVPVPEGSTIDIRL